MYVNLHIYIYTNIGIYIYTNIGSIEAQQVDPVSEVKALKENSWILGYVFLLLDELYLQKSGE